MQVQRHPLLFGAFSRRELQYSCKARCGRCSPKCSTCGPFPALSPSLTGNQPLKSHPFSPAKVSFRASQANKDVELLHLSWARGARQGTTGTRAQRILSPLFHAVSGETTSTRSAIRSARLDLNNAARTVTARIRISVSGAAIFPRKLLPPSSEREPAAKTAAPANHAPARANHAQARSASPLGRVSEGLTRSCLCQHSRSESTHGRGGRARIDA